MCFAYKLATMYGLMRFNRIFGQDTLVTAYNVSSKRQKMRRKELTGIVTRYTLPALSIYRVYNLFAALSERSFVRNEKPQSWTACVRHRRGLHV